MICLDRSAMKLSFSVLAGLLLQVVPVAGQDFVWARQMGGTGFPQSSGVALDGSGNVYTTGSFRGAADFDPGAGVFNLTFAGGPGSETPDIFVAKFKDKSSTGHDAGWAGDSGSGALGVAISGTRPVQSIVLRGSSCAEGLPRSNAP